MTVDPAETAERVEQESDPGPWTEEQWLSIPRRAHRVELLDGSLLVSPNPAPLHQQISRRLANLLDGPVGTLGGEVVEGVNVRMRTGRVLIPDLAVFYGEATEAISDPGEVRMLAEIVSPDQQNRDRVLKYAWYAEAGIPWYLIVEPGQEKDDGIAVSLHQRVHGVYKEVGAANAGEALALPDLEFEFDPAVLLGR